MITWNKTNLLLVGPILTELMGYRRMHYTIFHTWEVVLCPHIRLKPFLHSITYTKLIML